jgi:hypothetical protein
MMLLAITAGLIWLGIAVLKGALVRASGAVKKLL